MGDPMVYLMNVIITLVILIAIFYPLLHPFGIPYMIGYVKKKLSCMTNKKEQDHGQEEEQ